MCSVFALRGGKRQSRAHVLAPSALQIIHVRDLHQVGWPPIEVVGFDECITMNRFHMLEGEPYAAAKEMKP